MLQGTYGQLGLGKTPRRVEVEPSPQVLKNLPAVRRARCL